MVGFLGSISVYHLAVLPAIFVIGPVLMDRELDGANSWAVVVACFGAGAVVGDLIFMRWQPAYALRVGALLLVGASCQAAFIGSGLGTWGIGVLEFFAGICVTGTFTLWETSLGEHIPSRGAVAGLELRLPVDERGSSRSATCSPARRASRSASTPRCSR